MKFSEITMKFGTYRGSGIHTPFSIIYRTPFHLFVFGTFVVHITGGGAVLRRQASGDYLPVSEWRVIYMPRKGHTLCDYNSIIKNNFKIKKNTKNGVD